jgi:peptidoglycan hydrolase-like protein with peptidoglycan-binding domain
MVRRACAALALIAAVAAYAPPAAHAYGSPGVAAVQVTLRARGFYGGTIDGVRGPRTVRAVRAFQRRAGLAADGIVGPRTRAALGRFARRRIGARPMWPGMRGWDVAALQFMLAWHGFPSGAMDGYFGPRTHSALYRYQRWKRLGADGVAGPVTLRSLRSGPPRPPVSLSRPVGGGIGDRFGPRGNRFHTGLDFSAWYGARVRAARSGRVAYAGWDSGGYGYLVIVRHGRGIRTWYAHLSRISVGFGQRVGRGSRVGAVGASGRATGPHLHFELRVRGAAVNPLPALR